MQTLEPAGRYSPRVRAFVEDELEPSLGDTASAVTLPPACYTDPEFFEFEKDAIFYKEWLCLGRAEQVPNIGDYFTVTVVDEPLIVVRSNAEQIRVLSAVCRHRGMVITAPAQADLEDARRGVPESSGNSNLFRCPYHFWSYDLDGHLMSAPEMERTPSFRPDTVCLPSFQVELWNGFIFVNFDIHASPLSPRLERLERIIQNWHFDQLIDVEPNRISDMPWNWKVMHENSIENYHSDRLHAGLHTPLPSTNVLPSWYEDGEAAIITRIRAAEKDYSLNPTFRPLLPTIDTLTEEDRWLGVFALVPPSLLLGLNTDSAIYRIVLPSGVQSINITFGTLLPPKHLRSRRLREVRKMITESLRIFGRQDFPTNAAVQKGLRSRFAPRSHYSWQEDPLPIFNRWLVERYRSTI